MGNTTSHPSSPGGGTPNNGTATGGTTTAQPTSGTTTSARPIATSSTGAGSTANTFHSGLTPPNRTPSPPPPSTPPLLPYGGHLSSQNPHALSLPQASDYSKTIVTKLILEARLAPFYRGMEDWEEEYTPQDAWRILNEVRDKDYEDGVGNSVVEAMKADRAESSGPSSSGGTGSVARRIGIQTKASKEKDARLQHEKEEALKREAKAYVGAIECPICFLNYPQNINTSRCCQQPICTECFVQIKRSEATMTHLESDPACCPFCMETDFGVIYEKPLDLPSSSDYDLDASALSVSPEHSTALSSNLSQALSLTSEDAELSTGVGMGPAAQEKMRRKSVSHTNKEVVTIDEIRPDWEMKLNAVKAAAARKASRRIVMRQVGDRLIPIGYTSARAPGTADFSMSIPSADASGGSSPRRDRRRGSGRERDLEQLMLEAAIQQSLIDHEQHQQRQEDEAKGIKRPESDYATGGNGGSGSSTPTGTGRRFTLSVPGQSGGILSSGSSSRRASEGTHAPYKHEKSGSTASKIFSKFGSGNRSRSGSTASSLNRVTFSPSATHLPNVQEASGAQGKSSPRPEERGRSGTLGSTSTVPVPGSSETITTTTPTSAASTAPPPAPLPLPTPTAAVSGPPTIPAFDFGSGAQPTAIPRSHTTSTPTPSTLGRSPPSSLTPALATPVAPVTTLANHTSVNNPSPSRSPRESREQQRDQSSSQPTGLPRLSLDMQPLSPSSGPSGSLGKSTTIHNERTPQPRLQRLDTDDTIGPVSIDERPTYARLESDGP